MGGLLVIFWILYIIFLLAIIVYSTIVYWIIFEKAGHPGWAALIPIYNTYILVKIAGMHGITVLGFFVPILNIVLAVIFSFRFAESFGKSKGWGYGLFFLTIIFMSIIAFDNSKHIGSSTVETQQY